MLDRRAFLAQLPLFAGAMQAQPKRRPNVLIIYADDLGYGDLSCFGSKEIPTPNIDSIAKNGVRFTDGYVSNPVCAASRAGLMTGRYPHRFGFETNFMVHTRCEAGVIDENAGLPIEETTLADRLKAAGYKTGALGKWHLGMAPKYHPLRRGFDYFYGFLDGTHSFLDQTPNRWPPQVLESPDDLDILKAPLYRNNEIVRDEKGYLTEILAREAVSFINTHKSEPFFLHAAFNAPHTPLEATQKYLDRFPNLTGARKVYAAMMGALDDGVGRILQTVREAKIEKDTLVFFISDNGGSTYEIHGATNGPLAGFKNMVWEGGIRVPFLCQWPGQIPAGKVYSKPVMQLDVMATALAAAGTKPPTDRAIDSVDLTPYLTGQKPGSPHEFLFWRQLETYKTFEPSRAARKGDFKLILLGEQQPRLFNLAKDMAETQNVASKHPEIVAELRAALAKWDSQMSWPRWESGYWERPPRGRLPLWDVKDREKRGLATK